MSFQTTLKYDESLLRKAVLSFWWRAIGFKYTFALGLLTFSLGYCLYLGDRSWFVGALAAVLFVGVAFAIAIYTNHFNNAQAKLKAMGLPQASFSATETSIIFESGAGSSTLPWASVTEVWQFNEYWLLLFSKSQFVTLPLADLPPDFRSFILSRVQASGGAIT